MEVTGDKPTCLLHLGMNYSHKRFTVLALLALLVTAVQLRQYNDQTGEIYLKTF
jgi:hypothetical protein